MLKFTIDEIVFLGGIFAFLQLLNWRSDRGIFSSYKRLPLSTVTIQHLSTNPTSTISDLLTLKSDNGSTIRKIAINHIFVSNILPWLIFLSIAFYLVALLSFGIEWVSGNLITINYNSSFWSSSRLSVFGLIVLIIYFIIILTSGFYQELHDSHPDFQTEKPWRIILGLSYAKKGVH